VLVLLAGCLPQQKGYLRRFDGTVIDRPESDPLVRGASPAVLTVEAVDGRRRLLGFGTGFVVGPGTVLAPAVPGVVSSVGAAVMRSGSAGRDSTATAATEPPAMPTTAAMPTAARRRR